MFTQVADIHTADMLNLPMPKVKYVNVVSQASEYQKEYIQEIGKRAEAVRNRSVDASVDNMLNITTDGRLIDPARHAKGESKVDRLIENAYQEYQESEESQGAQIIFCDLATPNKDGRFSVYDAIRDGLRERGVPEGEIAYVHDADSDAKKATLFSKVRKGKVRFLLGSTAKMGAGTNVRATCCRTNSNAG